MKCYISFKSQKGQLLAMYYAQMKMKNKKRYLIQIGWMIAFLIAMEIAMNNCMFGCIEDHNEQSNAWLWWTSDPMIECDDEQDNQSHDQRINLMPWLSMRVGSTNIEMISHVAGNCNNTLGKKCTYRQTSCWWLQV